MTSRESMEDRIARGHNGAGADEPHHRAEQPVGLLAKVQHVMHQAKLTAGRPVKPARRTDTGRPRTGS